MATEQRLIDASAAADGIIAQLEIEWGYDGIREDVQRIFDSIPVVDAVEVPDKELLRAIKLLIKQYEHSKNSEYVHSPVAHALYHTWRQVDERRTDHV